MLNGRDQGKLDSAAGRLNEGIEARVAAFDVTDLAAVRDGVDVVEAKVG